jgi:hypothetical protein
MVIEQLEGLSQRKISKIPSEIESVTFWLVAQCSLIVSNDTASTLKMEVARFSEIVSII